MHLCAHCVVHNGVAYMCLDEVGLNDNDTLILRLKIKKRVVVMLKDSNRTIKQQPMESS